MVIIFQVFFVFLFRFQATGMIDASVHICRSSLLPYPLNEDVLSTENRNIPA